MTETTPEPPTGEALPLVSRPYMDRQLIVVIDDAIVETERQVGKLVERQSLELSDTIPAMASLVASAAGVAAGPAGAVIAGIAGNVLQEWVGNWMKTRGQLQERGLSVVAVGRSEAASLKLPIGHPRHNVIYVGHPSIPSVYYTAHDFHQRTFEHKFAEAVRLLMALGATRIEVEYVQGWGREFAATLESSIPTAVAEIAAKAGTSSTSGSQILYKATLPANKSFVLPDDLVWYHFEPTWQAITNGRLNHGLDNFSLTVRYTDDFGINAGVKAAVNKVGLDLGGKFEDFESTVWRIVGEFGPPPEIV